MRARFALSLAMVASLAVSVVADEKKPEPPLAYTMKSLTGADVDLSKYKGKVVMIVNVASKCGLTPQYKELQALHEKYGDDGLAILGFPCNQFGRQEPGSAAEISEFCTSKYGVKFDMFAKVNVNTKKDEEPCDLYKFLTSVETNPKFAGKIKWNFEKFLVDREGKVVARFSPRTKPTSKDVVSVIESKLAEK